MVFDKPIPIEISIHQHNFHIQAAIAQILVRLWPVAGNHPAGSNNKTGRPVLDCDQFAYLFWYILDIVYTSFIKKGWMVKRRVP